jgi:hypothetical protein
MYNVQCTVYNIYIFIIEARLILNDDPCIKVYYRGTENVAVNHWT